MWSPAPAIGGAQWQGNATLATTRQLLSTSAGLANTGDSNFDVVKVSTLFVSTITSIDGQSLLNIKNLSSIVVSTFRNYVQNSENIQTTSKLNNYNFLNGTYLLQNRDADNNYYNPLTNNTDILTGSGSFQAITGALTVAATNSTLNLYSGEVINITGRVNANSYDFNNIKGLSSLFLSTGSTRVGTSDFNSISSIRISTGSFRASASVIDSISSLRVSTGAARIGVADIGTLTVGSVALSGNLDMCNNNISNVNTLTATTVNAGTVAATAGNFTTLSGTLTGNVNGNLTGNVTGNISNANLTVLGQYSITETADVGSAISNYGSYGRVDIAGKGGLGGIVTITADVATPLNPAVTVSQLTAEAKGNYGLITAGSPVGYIPRGGLVSIIARQGLTPSPPAVVTSQLFGNGQIVLEAYSYNLVPGLIQLISGANAMYAGAITPLTGIYGNNYIFGQFGNSILAGLPPGGVPNTPGENYIYGLTGTVIDNGLYTDTIYNKFGGDLNLNARTCNLSLTTALVGGRSITLTSLTINIAGTLSLGNNPISAVGSITMSNAGSINMSNGSISNVTQYTGTSISTLALQASNAYISSFASSNAFITLLNATTANIANLSTTNHDNNSISTINLQASNALITNLQNTSFSTVNFQATNFLATTVTTSNQNISGVLSTSNIAGTPNLAISASNLTVTASTFSTIGILKTSLFTALYDVKAVGAVPIPTVVTFSYTGVVQPYVIPAGVTLISVIVDGAGGGGNTAGAYSTPGSGCRVTGDIDVTPGETLTFGVGQGGGVTPQAIALHGGGGAGLVGGLAGGTNGGGRSWIVRGTVQGEQYELVTAGGGGGAAAANFNTPANNGGSGQFNSPNGVSGNGVGFDSANPSVLTGGQGGDLTTNGAPFPPSSSPAPSNPGQSGGPSGIKQIGGSPYVLSATQGAGAGGGGWRGGGGGSYNGSLDSFGGGGAGSSQGQGITNNLTFINGGGAGPTRNGAITISYILPPPPPITFNGSMDISGGEFSSAGNQITTFIQVQGGSTQSGSFNIESSQQNVTLNGQTFATKDWSCTASVSAFSIPPPYAVNQAAVSLSQLNGLWAIQSLMSLATLPVSGVSVVWNIALVLVPKGLAGGSQIGATPPPLVSSSGFALNIPFTLMSSITGSTMTVRASENLALLANLTAPPFVSTGNITIAGTNVVGLIGDETVIAGSSQIVINCDPGDVNIIATSTISLAGGSNVSIQDMTFTTNNPYNWTGGTIHTLYGDVINGDKYLQWSYNNNPGTLLTDNNSINITAPSINLTGNTGVVGALYMNQNNIEDVKDIYLKRNLIFQSTSTYIADLGHIYGNTASPGGGLAIDYMYGLFFNSAGNDANIFASGGYFNLRNNARGIEVAGYNPAGTGDSAFYVANNELYLATGAGHDVITNSGRNISMNAAFPGGFISQYTSTIYMTSLADTYITADGNTTLRADRPGKSITSIASTITLQAATTINLNGITTMNDNPIRLRNDANHALAFGNTGTYNVGVDGPFLVGYRGGALGSSDPTFNDKSFAWSYSNLVAYKPLNMNSNSINNVSTFSRMLSGTAVDQPIIQYGTDGVSGGSGSVNITLDTPYSSSNSYVAFACMMDTDPAQMAVARVDSNIISISWANGGGGSHTLSWQTMGT